MGQAVVDTAKLETLIAEAKASGGSERANYQHDLEKWEPVFG